jgi:uncharacterized protein YeaO (DUF488 family)
MRHFQIQPLLFLKEIIKIKASDLITSDSKKRVRNMKIKIKRVYEKPDKDDGKRILVDRLWPRGLTKRKASIDLWLKDIAPSTELRKWFDHDPARWKEFQKRYHQELKNNKEQVSILYEQLKKEVVTLVYGAKDEEHNDALVLKEWITVRLGK